MPTYGDNQCLGRVLGVNLDADDNTDVEVTIPNGGKRYDVTRVIATNVSADISGDSAEVGLHTAPLGAGVDIVADTTVAELTAPEIVKSFTVASTDTIITSTLYISLSVPNGNPATADFYIFGNIYS